MQVAPLALRVEQTYITNLLHTLHALSGPYATRLTAHAVAGRGLVDLVRAADVGAVVDASTRLVSSHQVYVEFLFVAPLHVLMSFMPAPYSPTTHAGTVVGVVC